MPYHLKSRYSEEYEWQSSSRSYPHEDWPSKNSRGSRYADQDWPDNNSRDGRYAEQERKRQKWHKQNNDCEVESERDETRRRQEERECEVYEIGQRVECRDAEDPGWGQGVVTSVDPLQVRPDNSATSFQFDEVRPISEAPVEEAAGVMDYLEERVSALTEQDLRTSSGSDHTKDNSAVQAYLRPGSSRVWEGVLCSNKAKPSVVDTVIVSGSTTNLRYMGIYAKQAIEPGEQHAGRAIYKHTEAEGVFLHFWGACGKWIIGEDYNCDLCWLHSRRTNSHCPRKAKAWKEKVKIGNQHQFVSVEVSIDKVSEFSSEASGRKAPSSDASNGPSGFENQQFAPTQCSTQFVCATDGYEAGVPAPSTPYMPERTDWDCSEWEYSDSEQCSRSSMYQNSASIGQENASSHKADAESKQVKPDERTTLFLRNLPQSFTRSKLQDLLNRRGFLGRYDFIYMPTKFLNKKASLASVGYAYLNFVEHGDAQQCFDFFHGNTNWDVPSERACDVVWSDKQQGLPALIDRFRNVYVMHESFADEYKPAVFVAGTGARAMFPAPTKQLRPMKARHYKEVAGRQSCEKRFVSDVFNEAEGFAYADMSKTPPPPPPPPRPTKQRKVLEEADVDEGAWSPWRVSSSSQATAEKATEDAWGTWGGSSSSQATADKDVSNEKRVHPKDASRTSYTFADFLHFTEGDTRRASKMWNESEVVEDVEAAIAEPYVSHDIEERSSEDQSTHDKDLSMTVSSTSLGAQVIELKAEILQQTDQLDYLGRLPDETLKKFTSRIDDLEEKYDVWLRQQLLASGSSQSRNPESSSVGADVGGQVDELKEELEQMKSGADIDIGVVNARISDLEETLAKALEDRSKDIFKEPNRRSQLNATGALTTSQEISNAEARQEYANQREEHSPLRATNDLKIKKTPFPSRAVCREMRSLSRPRSAPTVKAEYVKIQQGDTNDLQAKLNLVSRRKALQEKKALSNSTQQQTALQAKSDLAVNKSSLPPTSSESAVGPVVDRKLPWNQRFDELRAWSDRLSRSRSRGRHLSEDAGVGRPSTQRKTAARAKSDAAVNENSLPPASASRSRSHPRSPRGLAPEIPVVVQAPSTQSKPALRAKSDAAIDQNSLPVVGQEVVRLGNRESPSTQREPALRAKSDAAVNQNSLAPRSASRLRSASNPRSPQRYAPEVDDAGQAVGRAGDAEFTSSQSKPLLRQKSDFAVNQNSLPPISPENTVGSVARFDELRGLRDRLSRSRSRRHLQEDAFVGREVVQADPSTQRKPALRAKSDAAVSQNSLPPTSVSRTHSSRSPRRHASEIAEVAALEPPSIQGKVSERPPSHQDTTNNGRQRLAAELKRRDDLPPTNRHTGKVLPVATTRYSLRSPSRARSTQSDAPEHQVDGQIVPSTQQELPKSITFGVPQVIIGSLDVLVEIKSEGDFLPHTLVESPELRSFRDGNGRKMYLKFRPYVQEFIEELVKKYQYCVTVLTHGYGSDLAKAAMNYIDPSGLVLTFDDDPEGFITKAPSCFVWEKTIIFDHHGSNRSWFAADVCSKAAKHIAYPFQFLTQLAKDKSTMQKNGNVPTDYDRHLYTTLQWYCFIHEKIYRTEVTAYACFHELKANLLAGLKICCLKEEGDTLSDLGGVFVEIADLSPAVNVVILDSKHDKASVAREMGLPIVTSRWIHFCCATLGVQNPEAFATNKLDQTSKDLDIWQTYAAWQKEDLVGRQSLTRPPVNVRALKDAADARVDKAEKKLLKLVDTIHESHRLHRCGYRFVFCENCGYHAEHHAYSLLEPCRGLPSREENRQPKVSIIASMVRGVHPRIGQWVGRSVVIKEEDGPIIISGINNVGSGTENDGAGKNQPQQNATIVQQHRELNKSEEADDQEWDFGRWKYGDMPDATRLKELKITCGSCLNRTANKGHVREVRKGMVCFRYPNAKKRDGVPQQHRDPNNSGKMYDEKWDFGPKTHGAMPTEARLKDLKITCGKCLAKSSKTGHREFIRKGMVCFYYPNAKRRDGVPRVAPEKKTTPADAPSILPGTSLPVTPAVDLLGSNMNLEKVKKLDTEVYQIGQRVECRDAEDPGWGQGVVTSVDPLQVRPDNSATSFQFDAVRPLSEAPVEEVVHAESVAVSPTLLCEPCVNPEVPASNGSQDWRKASPQCDEIDTASRLECNNCEQATSSELLATDDAETAEDQATFVGQRDEATGELLLGSSSGIDIPQPSTPIPMLGCSPPHNHGDESKEDSQIESKTPPQQPAPAPALASEPERSPGRPQYGKDSMLDILDVEDVLAMEKDLSERTVRSFVPGEPSSSASLRGAHAQTDEATSDGKAVEPEREVNQKANQDSDRACSDDWDFFDSFMKESMERDQKPQENAEEDSDTYSDLGDIWATPSPSDSEEDTLDCSELVGNTACKQDQIHVAHEEHTPIQSQNLDGIVSDSGRRNSQEGITKKEEPAEV